MRTGRIITRQNLKQELATCKQLIQHSRPLIEAMNRLKQTFETGVATGRHQLQKEIDDAKAEAEAKAAMAEYEAQAAAGIVPKEDANVESVSDSRNS